MQNKIKNIFRRFTKINRKKWKIVAQDPKLWELLSPDSNIEKIATGFKFTEGPIWNNVENCLYFSDIPDNKIYKWLDNKLSIYRSPSNHSNGLTLDRQGNLITCEHSSRRVTRTESDGKITILADSYNGKRLNSPNDVVVKSDGSIYFTDPPYGIKPHEQELDYCGVYRIDPNGKLILLTKMLEGPNGLAFSLDESQLYVDDSLKRNLNVFKVNEDGTLSEGKLICDMNTAESGNPDGMKLDVRGNLYVTGPGGVWVFTPDIEHIGTIVLPEIPANCAWGDDGKTLYVTARTSVYRLRCLVGGYLLN